MADRDGGGRLGGRRQTLVVVLVLALAAAIVAVVVLVNRSPTPAGASAEQRTTGSATVRRRNLVATDTEAGTVSYSGAQTVYDRLGGTITWLPSVGQVIRPGGTLFRVDGAPVILMKGSTPAYRDLGPSDSDGADVLELNRNLIALGFDASAIVADDVWQDATTVGVELLQESEGRSETGTLTLGQVVFLPGPQLVSTVDATLGDGGGGGSSTPATFTGGAPEPQFVTLTHAGSTPTTATTSSTSSTSATTTPSTTTGTGTTPSRTAPSGTTGSGTTGSGTATSPTGPTGTTPPNGGQSLSALMELLRAETEQLRAEAQQLRAEAQALRGGGHGGSPGGTPGGGGSPGGSSGGGSPSGSSGNSGGTPSGSSGTSGDGNPGGGGGGNGDGGAGTAVLQTTSTHLIVTVDLSASSQSEARVGERVAVQMPAGNTVAGRISAVSPVAESSDSGSGDTGGGPGSGSDNGSGGGSSSTIPVTIALLGHHSGAGLDQAAVSVSFAQARARHVLSVPVTALIATGGGRYDVQEAAAPHLLIPVTTGLFAAGYVQISGPGLRTGLQVTDSQG